MATFDNSMRNWGQCQARKTKESLLRFQRVKIVYLLADKSGNEA